MNGGKRPGGLTALAVLNFIFAGMNGLGILGLVTMFAFWGKMPTENMDEATRAQIDAIQAVGKPMFLVIVVAGGITGVLLLASGVGYLKQKKFLGRFLGNVYAITAIIQGTVTGMMLSPAIGGGFNLGSIIGLIYPVLTLALLNTTFKEDFIN